MLAFWSDADKSLDGLLDPGKNDGGCFQKLFKMLTCQTTKHVSSAPLSILDELEHLDEHCTTAHCAQGTDGKEL